ncbi:Unknown protein [Striga hermonthica]|uniref:Retroviral polymerase SH3-like domain-containing protein n=1 Tax=Striga hermonthica TaxID=68872 RepID=A0A9N7MS38_STRHE|nr:Unknown protein [Striga hermonthica]
MLYDPLPSVSKAFSMVLTIERQRSVHNSYDKIDNVAMNVRSGGYGRGQINQGRGYVGRGGSWQSGRGRVLTATFIINRLPSALLNWISLFEKVYGKAPDYTRLKPFGCLAYAAKVSPLRSKFEYRGHKCIFLGLGPGKKGYQLYDMDSGDCFLERDVVFFEDTLESQPKEVVLPRVMEIDSPSEVDIPSTSETTMAPDGLRKELRKGRHLHGKVIIFVVNHTLFSLQKEYTPFTPIHTHYPQRFP